MLQTVTSHFRRMSRPVEVLLRLVILLVLAAFLSTARAAMPAARPVQVRVDWEKFLARQDMIWERMPLSWSEGPFLGNGMMGASIYGEPDGSGLHIEVCRSDVQDHRDDSYGAMAFSRPRLPIGFFTLKPAGKIKQISMRLDLWNAEARGRLTTDQGDVNFRAFVASDQMLIIVEITTNDGERGAKWQWNARTADSPRQTYGLAHHDGRNIAGYKPNPPHQMKRSGEVEICLQPLLMGGQSATAWRETSAGNTRHVIVNVSHSWPANTAEAEAVQTVNRFADTPVADLAGAHRAWWHAFYPQSFVSIPDPRLESFWWIQMYKLASATRADRALIDNQGPWLDDTPWPYATWNLNVQLTYWPMNAANHVDLGESLWRSLDRHRQALIENVPEKLRADSAGIGRATGQDLIGRVEAPGEPDSRNPEMGNLTWALHDAWLAYRFSMNEPLLREVVFPLLRRSVNYYLHFLEEGTDGRMHLPVTTSPEFGNAPDCNYDLSLLRWGCGTLIRSCAILRIDDPLLPKWKEVLEKLTPYPVDQNGFMVGRGVSFTRPHRHYSHLLMVYPLQLVNWDQPENRGLIEHSLQHWTGFGRGLQGYSLTGAASISAQMRRGDDAERFLNELLRRFVTSSTMHPDAGPVIETPLSAAQSLNDMLLQSWGDRIRVFPAIPTAWPDVAIHDMRAEGAFLVSAVRQGGMTRAVRVRSLAGEPCRVEADIAEVRVSAPRGWKQTDGGVLELDLRKGEEAVLYAPEWQPGLIIEPVAGTGPSNPFGLKANH